MCLLSGAPLNLSLSQRLRNEWKGFQYPASPAGLSPNHQRQPRDRRRRISLHHLPPQCELRLRRHEPPEAATRLAPQPRPPDRAIAIATAVHATMRHTAQQPVRCRPVQADRLQSSGTLISAHSLDRAGSKGHRLACSVEVSGEQHDSQRAHPMSPAAKGHCGARPSTAPRTDTRAAFASGRSSDRIRQ